MINPAVSSKIKIDRKSPVPLYLQISHHLREMILQGGILQGKHLPPSRKMAAVLGINRSTVVSAYNELISEGLAAAHVGQGTIAVVFDEDKTIDK